MSMEEIGWIATDRAHLQAVIGGVRAASYTMIRDTPHSIHLIPLFKIQTITVLDVSSIKKQELSRNTSSQAIKGLSFAGLDMSN